MNKFAIQAYYSRKEVIDAILEAAAGREAVGVFSDGGYESRPNVLQYSNDIISLAKRGITSFHISVERWKLPMTIQDSNYEELRTGWDFIIDIDSKIGMEGSKFAAIRVGELFKSHGLEFGLKFSGSRGFHLIVPWESFPKEINFKPTQSLYPELPRAIASFIREKIAGKLHEDIVSLDSVKVEDQDPYKYVEIEKGWGRRHLFRAPYSLNEKTWLASVVLDFKDLRKFTLDDAKPVKVQARSFIPKKVSSAERLIIDALDWAGEHNKLQETTKTEKGSRAKIEISDRIPDSMFPPCIKAILNGMSDGKKRSTFTLISFLRVANWSWPEIEKKVFEWNEKNIPKLPRNYLIAQLRWHQQQRKAIAPPNCDNETFYKSTGLYDICCKEVNHKFVKNPINYSMKTIIKERKLGKKKFRGFSCDVCNNSYKTMRSLMIHKGRNH